jgi:3-dehydroquinate synthase
MHATSSPATQQVRISLGDRSYPISIGAGLLGDPATWQDLPAASTALIVSNTLVAPLYAEALREALKPHYRRILQVVLPDGEAHKDWPTLQLIFDALLENGCDRKTVLFALGGGVVGDMTGFAAACYMRRLCRCRPRCWRRLIRPSAARPPSTTPWAKTWSVRFTSRSA